MSLQNLTLTTLQKLLPDSTLEELIDKIRSEIWICTVIDNGDDPISCIVNSRNPIQSMIENENFIRQILSLNVFHTYVGYDEVFYIFNLKYDLSWIGIQDFLSRFHIDIYFQDPVDPLNNFKVDITDIDSNHIYELNEKEKGLVHLTADYQEITEFVQDFPSRAKTVSWIELFYMNRDEQYDDIREGEKIIGDRNKKKLPDVDWNNLESYSEEKLNRFLYRLNPEPRHMDKEMAIILLKRYIGN